MSWFDRINRFYNTLNPITGERLWTKEMVADGVVAGKITVEQYYEITGEEYAT